MERTVTGGRRESKRVEREVERILKKERKRRPEKATRGRDTEEEKEREREEREREKARERRKRGMVAFLREKVGRVCTIFF